MSALIVALASYCGDDTPGCTDETPCADCLPMCNVFRGPRPELGPYVAQLGDLTAASLNDPKDTPIHPVTASSGKD